MRLRRSRVAVVLVACAFLLPAPAFAAAPDAYLKEMPAIDKVTAKIQGSDAFETAARQYTAFNWLESMVLELMGDRYVKGDMTAAEKTARDGYHDNYLRIQRELLASLPEGEREFRAGSRYAQWRALIDSYFDTTDFREQFMDTFFTAAFRKTYDPIHAAAIAQDPWVGFGDPPPATAPARDWSFMWWVFLGLGMLAGIGGGVRYGRRRTD